MTLKSTLVLFTLLVGTTQAATLNVISVDSARGRNISLNVDGSNSTFYAGVIVGSFDGSPSFDLFCVDLFTSIGYGLYDSYDRLPLLNGREDRVAWVYHNLYNRTTINTTNLGAGFQAAIWDIIHDGGDGPNAGRIRSSSNTPSAVINSWNSFLTQSLNQSSLDAAIYVNSKGLIPAQNLIGSPMSENPEPSTCAILGAGLLGIAWLRRSGSKSA
jgi:hypothetical protein